MPSTFGSVVRKACGLLDKFASDSRSVDAFIEEASTDLECFDPPERKFILQVVSGCAEYKKLLDVVVDAFYGQNNIWLCKSDRSQFIIICYLATFSLEKLGLEHFSSIVKSLGILKMHLFLDFFLSSLTSWVQEEWSSIYEAEFVETHWIAPLLRWRPKINHLMSQLVATKESEAERASTATTQCQEFSFATKESEARRASITSTRCLAISTKSKLGPPPKLIALQVPSSTYMPPIEMQIIDEIKEKNYQKAEKLLIEANAKQFRCGNPEKSEQTKRVISQIKADFDSKLKFDTFHSTRIPPSNKVDNFSVKLNNAAIWRREALHDRQVKEELQRIEQLVQGVPDPSPLLQKQREMLERDRQTKLQAAARTRLETQICEKEAALTRARIAEENQKTAHQMKEETARLIQIYAEERLQEEKELRDLVQQGAEAHKNPKIAKKKLKKLKQKIVKEVSEESQELLRQALEEQQEELLKKFKIILEIHALESVPRIRQSSFDGTETAGYELLSEMSLVELKERVAVLRQRQQKEEEERRSHILQEKQKKQQEIQETLGNIELHRRLLAKEAAERKAERKAKKELLQQAVAHDDTVLALNKELVEKKQACQRLKQAQRSRTSKCNRSRTGTPGQKDLKEKTWEELEQSLARYIQDAP